MCLTLIPSVRADVPVTDRASAGPSRLVSCALLAGLLLILSACGGGGSGTAAGGVASPPDNSAPVSPFLGPQAPSSLYAGQLKWTATQGGALAEDWSQRTCTVGRQRQWIASMLWEDHLFYGELPNLQPASYAGGLTDYFYALTRDSLPGRDRFSFVISQAQADGIFGGAPLAGLGLNLIYDRQGRLRVAAVEPAGPGGGLLARGDQIMAINGAVVGPLLTAAQFAALFSTPPGTAVQLALRNTLQQDRVETLTSAFYAAEPVPVSAVLPGNIGYLALTDFANRGGELRLRHVMQGFVDAGVQELVLDLRYNGGGFLAIASQLSYMIAGPAATTDRIFEQLIYNDKRSDEDFAIPFIDFVLGFAGPTDVGQSLPTLNLSRVHVLATQESCSASESLIIGLSGVDVEVVVHGTTTCGKPYGFVQRNNCTLAYFPIEFEGRNARNERVPVTGLAPNCPAWDDLDHLLGDPGEQLLASALNHIATGQCLLLAAEGPQAIDPFRAGPALLGRTPAQRIKLLN